MNMRTTVLATCAMAMLWAGCDGAATLSTSPQTP